MERIIYLKIFLSALLTCLTSVRATAALTVLPLGDSITAGYNGSSDYDTGYRGDLLTDLTVAGKSVQYVGVYDPTTYTGAGYDVAGYSPALTAISENEIAGFSGYTSEDLLNNLAGVATPLAGVQLGVTPNMGGYWITGGNGTGRSAITPNVVTLITGTNDPYHYSLATSEASIAGILSYFATNLPSTRVLIASGPHNADPTVDNFEGALNAWLPSVVTEYSQDQYIDIYDTMPAALLSTDGTHPTDAGYAIIASDFAAALAPLASAVPEPATCGTLAMSALILGRRRR